MTIRGINHVTLVVADLTRSLAFYSDILGAAPKAKWATGAYLDLGGLWLCLEQGAGVPAQGDTHIAFDCAADDFDGLAQKITEHATLWKDNHSEGASLYFLDPDGHKLELHVGDMQSRLAHYASRDDITIY